MDVEIENELKVVSIGYEMMVVQIEQVVSYRRAVNHLLYEPKVASYRRAEGRLL